MPLPTDPTMVDTIFATLSRRILQGEVKAGGRLRQEELATEFRASHVPVREAFRRLEAEGLVEALPRRGVRVAAMNHARHFEALEMRATLEALALRHAVSRFSPGHLVALTVADRACSAARDVEAWEAANHEFHRLLIAPCQMPQLMQAVARLQTAVRWGGRMLGGARHLTLPREDREHRAILLALQEDDAERAAAHLTRHIQRGHLSGQNNR